MIISAETSGVGGGRTVTLTVKMKKYEASAVKGLLENLVEHLALGLFAKESFSKMAEEIGKALEIKQADLNRRGNK